MVNVKWFILLGKTCVYFSNAKPLPRFNSIKDLRIIFSSSLSVLDHNIQSIIVKASCILGFIIRSTQDFTCVKSIKVSYLALVRSILEYGSVLLNHCQNVWVTKIERIQNESLH